MVMGRLNPAAVIALLSLAGGSVHGQEAFDVHLHALNPEMFAPVKDAQFGAFLRSGVVEAMVTDAGALLRRTVEEMDRNEVRQGLLSGDNVLVRRWVQAHPDRFLPSYTPDLSLKDASEAAAQFEKEVKEGKWRAMGELGLPYAGRPLNDPALFPYYEVCERQQIPVFFHTGLDGPEPQTMASPVFRVELGDPLLLQDIVVKWPRLKVVIMHMGWPFFDHALYMPYAYRNVYLDTGVVDWILGAEVFDRMLREAVDTAGSDRILFGSDQMVFPQMIKPAVARVRNAPYLTPTAKRNILWENATRLLGVPGR